MSIVDHPGNISQAPVTNAGAMEKTIRRLGIVPFFINAIPGYSIEELTPKELWFNEDNLGPWDWKIPCIQAGDIAYGKFLWGGKSAFATLEWYAELMNWRRSLPKYAARDGQQTEVLALVSERGSVGIKDIRERLGVKKSIADGIVTRLQQQTRLITDFLHAGSAVQRRGGGRDRRPGNEAFGLPRRHFRRCIPFLGNGQSA